MNRILCLISASFGASTLLSLLFGKTFCIPALIAFFIAAIVFTVSASVTKNTHFYFYMTAALISAVAVLLCLIFYLPALDNAKNYDGASVEAEGRIISISKGARYTVMTVSCTDIAEKRQNIAVTVDNNSAADADIGKKVYFSGELEFRDDIYSKGKECFLSTFPYKFEVAREQDSVALIISGVRSRIKNSSEDMQSSAMVNALVIGDKSGVGPELQDSLRKIGTTHILSISGLHLTIIVMNFYMALSALPIPNMLKAILCTLLSAFYTLITGIPLALVRSGIMMSAFFFSVPSRRENDSLTSLFAALMLVIAVSPWSVFDVGFLLSFAATLGIVTFTETVMDAYKIRERKRKSRKRSSRLQSSIKYIKTVLFSSIVTTLAATVTTMPFIIAAFNEFSAFSVIGNLVTVPFAEYLLSLSFLSVLFESCSIEFIALPLSFLSDIAGNIFTRLSLLLARISPDLVSLDPIYLNVGIAVIGIAVITALLFYRKPKSLFILVAFISVFIPLFNLCSSAIIYPTAVVDIVTKSGCNAAYVRYKGETYLLDLTASDSSKTVITGSAVGKNAKISNAVIISPESIPAKRISALCSSFDIERITLITNAETSDGRAREYLEEIDADIEIIRDNTYKVCEGITAHCVNKIGIGFVIEGNSKSLSFYKAISPDRYLPAATAADQTVLCSGSLPLSVNTAEKRSFRL